jgi:hypothetical protein
VVALIAFGVAEVLHVAAAVLSEVAMARALAILTGTLVAPTAALAILAEALVAPTVMTATVAALAAAIITALAPAAAVHGVLVLMRPQHAGEHSEAPLLGIVEARVKRSAGVGNLLERGAALAHGISALAHPIERAGWSLRLALLLGRLASLDTLHTQLNHIAQSRFERRPVFRLVRRQFQAGFQRRDTRIGKRRNIVSTEMTVLVLGAWTAAAVAVKPLLCVNVGRAADGESSRRGDYRLEHVILQR